MTTTTTATYENNARTREMLGWGYVLDYCVGDITAPKVTHDHRRGLFIFHD